MFKKPFFGFASVTVLTTFLSVLFTKAINYELLISSEKSLHNVKHGKPLKAHVYLIRSLL